MAAQNREWKKTDTKTVGERSDSEFSIMQGDLPVLTIQSPAPRNHKPLTIQSDGTVDARKFAGDGSDLKVGAGLSVKDALDQKAALNGSSGQDFQAKDLTVSNALSFGSSVRQMINLWNKNYGIGIQDMTQYFRTDKNFAWYKGGSHNNGELNAGGGKVQMVIKDGNVGIGKEKPEAPLDVLGLLKASQIGIGLESGQTPTEALEVRGKVKISDGLMPNYDSGWVADDRKTNHRKVFKHNLRDYPSLITIYFSPTNSPKGAIYPLIWPWRDNASANPVTIEVDKNELVLNIFKDQILHGVWSGRTGGWTEYNSGFWRVLLWR